MHPKLNPKLIERVQLLLASNPDALEFVENYKEYIHQIDDLIDNPDRPSSEDILKVFAKASFVFSLPFWKANSHMLFMLEQVINNTYADSVLWERSNVKWKQSDAGVLRHAGIEMFFAVILLVHGRETLRDLSSDFRTQCHNLHMDENFKAI